MADYEYSSSSIHDTWSSPSYYTTWDSSFLNRPIQSSDYEYYRYNNSASGPDSLSRLPYFDPFVDQSFYVPNPERQALWNSMTLREKITGTLFSLLVGGGTAFALGYLLT